MDLRILALFLTLTGCSLLNSNNIAPGYTEAFKNIANLYKEKENPNISSKIVQSIPYASSILKIGNGMPGLIILAEKKNKKEIWVSADGIYLIIFNGKIIETKGLFNNLIRSEIPYTLYNQFNQSRLQNFNYYLSYDNPPLYDLKLQVSIEVKGTEEVIILDRKRKLTLIEETLKNDYLGWNAVNSYWVDEDNFIWKSIQTISPKLPPFEIQVTKKPAN